MLWSLGRIGLVSVDLGGRLAVEADLEAVIARGDGDDLARVDQANMDLLGSDHDAAAGGHAPLDRDRAWGRWRDEGGPSRASKPMPFASRDRAGQDALQGAVVADNRHLGAFHPQADALSGKVEADVDLRAGQTDEA